MNSASKTLIYLFSFIYIKSIFTANNPVFSQRILLRHLLLLIMIVFMVIELKRMAVKAQGFEGNLFKTDLKPHSFLIQLTITFATQIHAISMASVKAWRKAMFAAASREQLA